MESELKNTRKEDFTDAKANGKIPGGYVTKGQKGVMNKQENNINQQLKQDEGGKEKPVAKPIETTEKNRSTATTATQMASKTVNQ